MTHLAKPFRESRLSVVSAVYKTEKTLGELSRRLLEIAGPLFESVEIIFVNDCSPDQSRQTLLELCQKNPSIRAVNFARNFGQHAALLAGLERAGGDYVLLIDSDLEESPEDMVLMMKKMSEGYEVVAGQRENHRKNPVRRHLAQIFFSLYNRLSDYPILHNATNMRLMTRTYVQYLLQFNERPFLAGISSWIGVPIGLIPVVRIEQGRRSSYSFLKLLGHARAGLLGFSTRPIRFSFHVGLVLTIGAATYSGFTILRHFLYGDVLVGYSSVVGLLCFLMGVQFIFLGLLGEYIGEIFISVKNRPKFLIYDQFNL